MIKTAALLLVLFLGLGATRDIVCQLACAEPGAPHAAAACHESPDLAGTLLQAVQDHCATGDLSPATTTFKINSVKDQSAAVSGRLLATPRAFTPLTQIRLPHPCASSPACGHSTVVLRI